MVALIRVATVGIASPKIVFKAAYIQHARTVNPSRTAVAGLHEAEFALDPGARPKKNVGDVGRNHESLRTGGCDCQCALEIQGVEGGEIRRQVGRRRNYLHVATRGLHVGWIEEEDETLNDAALLCIASPPQKELIAREIGGGGGGDLHQ